MAAKSTTTSSRKRTTQPKPTEHAPKEKRTRLDGSSTSTATTARISSNGDMPIRRPRGRPRKTVDPAADPTKLVPSPSPATLGPKPAGRSAIIAAKVSEGSSSQTSREQEIGLVRPTSKIVRRSASKTPTAMARSSATSAENMATTPARPKAAAALATSSKVTANASSKARAPTRVSKSSGRPVKRLEPPPVLPIVASSYRLLYAMEGHAEEDARTERANMWGCEYEPGTSVVAVCGGNTILFLDTQQGRYVKKYTHVESKEEFMCLAWTRLNGPGDLLDDNAADDDKCTVLAAAGRLGSIKLVNALQNQCFRHLFGHEKPVRKLQFSKTHSRWLFSASDDMTIRLWDIGAPINKQETNAICLAKFTLPSTASIPTAISAYNNKLLVGCMDGELVHFNVSDKDIIKKQQQQQQNGTGGDAGITVKTKTIYPAGDEWHEGYIDDVYILGQHDEESHALDGCIVSRGEQDYEILIWRYKSSTKKDADIAISLEWPESVDEVGLRMKVIERHGQKVLVAGDYDGQIRIYNFGDGKLSKTLEDNSKEIFPPTKVLSHPMSSGLVRDLCVAEDTGTIVAVDSANHIFVWSCK